MKTIFCLMLLLSTKALLAQKLAEADVPEIVKTSFSKAHPDVVGKWEREGETYEVVFTELDKEMSCVIDKSGTILETETMIRVNALPASIKGYIKDHYKGAIKEAAKIVKTNGEIFYEAEVQGKNLLFTEGGTFVKEDKEDKA